MLFPYLQASTVAPQEEGVTVSQTEDLSALPIRAYLDKTVVPILLLGLAETAKKRYFHRGIIVLFVFVQLCVDGLFLLWLYSTPRYCF